MQPKENYQHVLVSKTLFKRMVNKHARCSGCGMPADTHGGYGPCYGAHIIVDMEIINAIATKAPESDGRPEYHFVTNTPPERPGIDYEIRTVAEPLDPNTRAAEFFDAAKEKGFRLWE